MTADRTSFVNTDARSASPRAARRQAGQGMTDSLNLPGNPRQC